jgi:hypothetical protein
LARPAEPGAEHVFPITAGSILIAKQGDSMKRLLLILFSVPLIAYAQGDPLEDHFISPEVIMKHQGELGITAAQREQIKQQVRNAQVRFTELQWDIQAEIENLKKLLEDRAAAEAPVLEQLNRVLAVEADIKRSQVSMLMALRRVLTDEQLEQARGMAYGPFGGMKAEIHKTIQQAQREAVRAQKQQQQAMKQMLEVQKQWGESRPKDWGPGAVSPRD